MIEFQVQRANGLVSNAWGTSHIQNYFIDRTNLAFDQMAGHIVDIDFDTNGDGLEDVGDAIRSQRILSSSYTRAQKQKR